MSYLLGISGVAVVLFFAYRKLMDLRAERELLRMRVQQDQEKKDFNQAIQKSEEEIKNAKLRYDDTKRELGRDPV